MRRYRVGLVLVLLLGGLAAGTSAQVLGTGVSPVIDIKAITQSILAYKVQVEQYTKQLQQLYYEYQQLQQMVQQVEYSYQTVQHGVQNLARLDLNNAKDLIGLVSTMQGKLNQATQLSYNAQQAVAQAQSIYPRIQGVVNADQQRVLQLQWVSAQREAATIAIQTQAIQNSQAQYQQKWAEVLNRASQAQGNLQAQQAAVQGQGLLGTQLQGIEQQLATQARQHSEELLQQQSRREMDEAAAVYFDKTIDTSTPYTPHGRLLSAPVLGR